MNANSSGACGKKLISVKTKENVKVVGLLRASLLGENEVANVKITIFMTNVEILRFEWVADLLINRTYCKN